MQFEKCTMLIVSLLFIVQTHPEACCIVPNDYHMNITRYPIGRDSAVIIDISDITNPKNVQPFKDTLLPAELLSQLKMAYDTTKFVAVAHISEYISYWPELTTPEKVVYYTEKVTISIDTILKGTLTQHQKVMTNEIDGTGRRLKYDSLNNRYDTITSLLSLTEPGYDFIKNKRFLIFAQNESECFDLPLVDMCVFVTDAYIIDSNNQIYYEGINIDFSNGKVTNIPYLKLRFSDFVDNIKPVKTLKNVTIEEKSSISGNSVTAFNLLGKKMRPITSYDFLTNHSSSLLLINSRGEKGVRTKHLLINNN